VNDIKVGTIGGGQLAMMLSKAGNNLNIEFVSLVDNLDCPAKDVAT
jgi:phosphoribosylaminoimidazole carboxylase (NCAIR synthetase)